jgi:hypothetical protein
MPQMAMVPPLPPMRPRESSNPVVSQIPPTKLAGTGGPVDPFAQTAFKPEETGGARAQVPGPAVSPVAMSTQMPERPMPSAAGASPPVPSPHSALPGPAASLPFTSSPPPAAPSVAAYVAPPTPYVAPAPYGAPTAPAPYPATPAAYAPAPQGFAPGTRVWVTWSNGQRYPGTVHQVAGNQCLVRFDDGQQHWVEAPYLSVT